MVTVSLSETYDLSTKLNKMSLVGIHTPSPELLRKTFPGLLVNNRFFKLLSCSVKLACASMLPADPLQVGVTAGKIAPQDMFNPILYKALTNEGMGLLERRIAGLKYYTTSATPVLDGPSVTSRDEGITDGTDDFKVYYNILQNRKGWKIAHPQNGLNMSDLKPLVHECLYPYGDNEYGKQIHLIGNAPASGGGVGGLDQVTIENTPIFGGRARPMPKFNTMYLNPNAYRGGSEPGVTRDNIAEAQMIMDKTPEIPRTYVAGILLPPGKQNILYYRLVVRWKIAFFGVRPIQEIEDFYSLGSQVGTYYQNSYEPLARTMHARTEMVDVQDAEIEKIMEGA